MPLKRHVKRSTAPDYFIISKYRQHLLPRVIGEGYVKDIVTKKGKTVIILY